jgi:hypothetical protein
MTEERSLSPRAADDLRRISSDEALPLEEIICLECGKLNSLDVWSCVACGAQLMLPWGEISDGYLTALDLLRSGKLSSSGLRELLDSVRVTQSLYMAGTRYSVFG